MYFRLENKINEIKDYSENGLKDVKSTGLASLDEFVMLKKGFPLFVGGSPFSGKTEFTFELLMNTSIMYGWKHFIYCGEGGSIESIFNELLFKFLQKPYKFATPSEQVNAEMFVNTHFIIADHDKEFTIDEFYATVFNCEIELNIKFDTTTFDPFNDIKEDLANFGNREDKYLAYVLKQTRISSKKNNRIDILVNHIADVKTITNKDGIRYMPPAMPNEWAGGRTWWRRAFLMILVYRPNVQLTNEHGQPFLENETQIFIQKAKPKGIGRVGVRSIFWDWKKNRYYSYDNSNQKLYSCETKKDIQFKSLIENSDFLDIKLNNDLDMPF